MLGDLEVTVDWPCRAPAAPEIELDQRKARKTTNTLVSEKGKRHARVRIARNALYR